jgi:DNA-binding CsgD family transcriptional regulator
MEVERFERLTPRQRACLRRVRDLQTTKEIALALEISPATVTGYLDDAVAKIGARDRRDAALLFDAYEESHPEQFRGDSTRFDLPPPPAPFPIPAHRERQLDEDRVREVSTYFEIPQARQSAEWRLPFSTGDRRNDLGITQRTIWIIAIAVVILFTFGNFISAFEGIGRIGRTAVTAVR